MIMKKIILFLLIPIIFLLLLSSQCQDCLCTQEFVMTMITVETTSGDPIIDAVVSVQWKETGENIDVSDYDVYNSDGMYCVFTALATPTT